LDEADKALLEQRKKIWQAISLSDAAHRKSILDQVAEDQATLVKAVDDYEKNGLVGDAKDGALLGDDRKELAQATPVLTEALTLQGRSRRFFDGYSAAPGERRSIGSRSARCSWISMA